MRCPTPMGTCRTSSAMKGATGNSIKLVQRTWQKLTKMTSSSNPIQGSVLLRYDISEMINLEFENQGRKYQVLPISGSVAKSHEGSKIQIFAHADPMRVQCWFCLYA